MMYDVQFTPKTKKILARWKKSNPSSHKKMQKILMELRDHPRTGTGHPEALVGMGGNVYSRRITAQDRLIYEIHDDIVVVLVLQVEGHYDDK